MALVWSLLFQRLVRIAWRSREATEILGDGRFKLLSPDRYIYDQESVRAAPELSGLSRKGSLSDSVGEHGWSSHVKRCSSVGNRNQTGPAVGWDDV